MTSHNAVTVVARDGQRQRNFTLTIRNGNYTRIRFHLKDDLSEAAINDVNVLDLGMCHTIRYDRRHGNRRLMLTDTGADVTAEGIRNANFCLELVGCGKWMSGVHLLNEKDFLSQGYITPLPPRLGGDDDVDLFMRTESLDGVHSLSRSVGRLTLGRVVVPDAFQRVEWVINGSRLLVNFNILFVK